MKHLINPFKQMIKLLIINKTINFFFDKNKTINLKGAILIKNNNKLIM